MTSFYRVLLFSISIAIGFNVVASQYKKPCMLFDYDSTWRDANKACQKRNSFLLCHKSEKDTRQIIEYFYPPQRMTKNLMFWLSTDNCNDLKNLKQCLSLVVAGSWPHVWYYVQASCVPKSFICCPIQEGTTTSTSTEKPKVTIISDKTVTELEITTTLIVSTNEITGSNNSLIPPSTTRNLPWTSSSSESNTESSSVSPTSESNVESSSISSSSESITTKALESSSSGPHSTFTTVITTTDSLSSSSKPFCLSVKKRAILWPDTPLGVEVTMPCPGHSIGNASWFCDEQTMSWTPNSPNMTKCHSTELRNIKDKFLNETSDETINALQDLFSDSSESLQGNDLQDAMELISLLPNKLIIECQLMNHTERWERAEESVIKTTAIFSKMMNCDTWTDIAAEEVPKVGSRMLSAADDFVLFLADSMKNATHYSTVNPNIAVEILKKEYGQAVTLPLEVGEHFQRGQIKLEGGYDADLPHEGVISIIYIYYSNMSHILLAENTASLNSPVVSTSVSHGGQKATSVNGHVDVLVEHLYADQNDTACVFWNFRQHTWDPTGCRLKSSNSTHTLCECNHLTNFAVLMDYKGVLVDVDDKAFFYITLIGCSISIVCLAICIVIFTFYRWQRLNSWGIRYTIHRNLCITLFLGNILLVAGLNQVENHVTCAIIAGILHYLFLSAFSWMLLEGVHIYILLVVVFASKRTHWEKYYLFGYGFPLLVVAITAAIRPESYGTENICWLAFIDGTTWGFTGPVAVILLLNSAALFLAQVKASKISSKDDNIAAIKRWLRVTFILFPVLGLTWVLGFLYVGKNFKVVAYIFAILNSFQGLCIFVCHCLMDKRARNMVLNSIKEKISSTGTESSSLKKRSRKDSKKSLMRKKSQPSPPRVSWYFSWKPWTFHFKLNFIRKTQVQPLRERSSEEPEIIQWKKLQEERIM